MHAKLEYEVYICSTHKHNRKAYIIEVVQDGKTVL